jgi:hypothetical protein
MRSWRRSSGRPRAASRGRWAGQGGKGRGHVRLAERAWRAVRTLHVTPPRSSSPNPLYLPPSLPAPGRPAGWLARRVETRPPLTARRPARQVKVAGRMRVLGGSAAGKRLACIQGGPTRPMMEKASWGGARGGRRTARRCTRPPAHRPLPVTPQALRPRPAACAGHAPSPSLLPHVCMHFRPPPLLYPRRPLPSTPSTRSARRCST